jgi:cytochrome P450
MGQLHSLTPGRMVYYLCKNPEIKARLIAELKAALPSDASGNAPLPFNQVRQTRLLDHVELECLRMHPPIGYSMPRDTPKQGANICGVFVPGGVAVGVPAAALGRNADIYPQPDVWDPDRWSGSSNNSGDLAMMKISFLGFGHGSRQCIGRNVADQFIQKMIAQLLLRYDIELEDQELVLNAKEFTIQKPDKRYRVVLRPAVRDANAN